MASLSGGERARLLFLALSLASHHLLWLDEPTNHLDLAGKRELATALAGFAGGVLLVSHDRELIEASCNRFWVLCDGRLTEWPDADAAYRALFAAPSLAANLVTANKAQPVQATAADEDAQWQRLYQLEALLQADLARKPKHQKPQQQHSWREEMDVLERRLGLQPE